MPLQSAGELIRSVPNSPNKEMGDAALRRSCVRLVRKERREINTVLLEGVNVEHSVESLAKLSDALWFCDADHHHVVSKHMVAHWWGNVWIFSKFTSSGGR